MHIVEFLKGINEKLDAGVSAMSLGAIAYDELQQHKGLFLPHGVMGRLPQLNLQREVLGNEVTSEQWDRIMMAHSATYISDYWTINGQPI